MLLLLESSALRESDKLPHDRIVRSVLSSYLEQSSGTRSGTGVPLFLLNDVVRYWRTMTVDYSAKRRERDDEGWALRRLKLRTSRKLIFAAGLIMCLDYHVRVVGRGEAADPAALLDNLIRHVAMTPLEALADAAHGDGELERRARAVFDEYNRFLALLDDSSDREALRQLSRDTDANAVFERAETIGDEFGRAIEAFFFDATYGQAIRTYGVF